MRHSEVTHSEVNVMGRLDFKGDFEIPHTPEDGEFEPESGAEVYQLRSSVQERKPAKLEQFTGKISQWQHVAKAASYKIPDIDREDVSQDILVQFIEHSPHSWAGCWAMAHGAIADYWRRQHPRSSQDVSFDSVVSHGEDGEALTLGDVIPHGYNDILASEARQILRGLPQEIAAAARLACQALPRGNPRGWGVQERRSSILNARLGVAAYARAEGIM